MVQFSFLSPRARRRRAVLATANSPSMGMTRTATPQAAAILRFLYRVPWVACSADLEWRHRCHRICAASRGTAASSRWGMTRTV